MDQWHVWVTSRVQSWSWTCSSMIDSWLWKDPHLVSVIFWSLLLFNWGESSSTIIENIKATVIQDQPEIGLVYFYFDINDTAKQTSRSLLSYLVLCLTSKSNNYTPIKSLYESHNKLNIPTEDELLELLLELLQHFKHAHVYVVIHQENGWGLV